LLHCVGMAIHRDGHEDFSLFLAEPKQRELLKGLYEEPELTVIASEVLHAITSHREYGKPLTPEAGIVRVADALDMANGRSRVPATAPMTRPSRGGQNPKRRSACLPRARSRPGVRMTSPTRTPPHVLWTPRLMQLGH